MNTLRSQIHNNFGQHVSRISSTIFCPHRLPFYLEKIILYLDDKWLEIFIGQQHLLWKKFSKPFIKILNRSDRRECPAHLSPNSHPEERPVHSPQRRRIGAHFFVV
ncbi:unnamed protein product [Allacma fusca]|uniref:Uncharacterized protein n=1 Tax=Allacma fusca TaxID=39272 RepID=A0A8J2JYG1_9HEXA|nr:unnamed protein product [Allacma fusca]